MLAKSGPPVPPDAQKAFAVLERYRCPQPLLIVISGPSGVGKDSVIKTLAGRDYQFHFVVTATDRPKRAGEVHGVDYYFASADEFARMIAEEELFEWAWVYGQQKGVPKAHARQALASGLDVIMRLDVQGAATIKHKVPDALSIFIAPPSLEVLVDRLRRRGGDSAAQLQQRLKMAIAEMARLDEFDYIVINEENRLEKAADQILGIIAAEKRRIAPRRIDF